MNPSFQPSLDHGEGKTIAQPSHASQRLFYRLMMVVLILGCAYAWRVYRLGEKQVWWDEAWSVITAQQPFDQTTELTARDVHPPLYQWALHGWVRFVGISEFAVRYLSLLVGMITVAGVYALTLRLSGRPTARIAALLIAGSAFHIHWSQETRMYALAACLTVLAAYAYWRISEKITLWWLLLIMSGVGVTLTHYLGGFVMVILNLHWLLTVRQRSMRFHRQWVGAMVASACLLAFWMLFAFTRIRSGGAESIAHPMFIFQLATTLIAVGTSANIERYLLYAVLCGIVVLGGLMLARFPSATNTPLDQDRIKVKEFAWLALVVPPCAIFLLSLPNPFYHPRPEERYLLIFAPLTYTVVSMALMGWLRWYRPLGLLIGVGVVLLYGSAIQRDQTERYYQDDYKTLFHTAAHLIQPNEPLFFVSGDRYPLVDYHLNRATDNRIPFYVGAIPRIQGDGSEVLLERIIGSSRRFWLVEIERNLGDPENRVLPYIEARYRVRWQANFGYNRLTLYVARDLANEAVEARPPMNDRYLPPLIREVRPDDVIRVGVPAQGEACLWRQQQRLICSTVADTWSLFQVPIYAATVPNTYVIRLNNRDDDNYDSYNRDDYAVQVTHTHPTPHPIANLNVDFGAMKLIGYELATRNASPNQPFTVTLYWQAQGKLTTNYTAFIHLLGTTFNPDTNGILWAGKDSYPSDTPTSALEANQLIRDERTMLLPPNTPLGTYQLEIGLYQLETGERLKRQDTGADQVLIDGIVIK